MLIFYSSKPHSSRVPGLTCSSGFTFSPFKKCWLPWLRCLVCSIEHCPLISFTVPRENLPSNWECFKNCNQCSWCCAKEQVCTSSKSSKIYGKALVALNVSNEHLQGFMWWSSISSSVQTSLRSRTSMNDWMSTFIKKQQPPPPCYSFISCFLLLYQVQPKRN